MSIVLKNEIGTLLTLFARGKKTYNSYLEEQAYLYARILRDNNKKIHHILLRVTHLMTDDLKSECLDLMHHIDVWMTKWDYLDASKVHELNDTFVFQNDVNYPKNIEQKFKKLYETIK